MGRGIDLAKDLVKVLDKRISKGSVTGGQYFRQP